MIPKKIHYCWFGRGEKPKLAQKCINSWKKYCPDYELIEWNEDNFDINSNQYVREAYQNRKFAFVTDYVRLYAMCTYGGIYMDTDVEVVRPLDEFLKHQAFSGFESGNFIPTGIMACEKGFPLFMKLLKYYDEKRFIREDGTLDTTTNTVTITNLCNQYGLVLNNKFQELEGFALYPSDFFCPLENETGIVHRTPNTATIHWFAKSWVDGGGKLKMIQYVSRLLHRLFGTEFVHNVAVKIGVRK